MLHLRSKKRHVRLPSTVLDAVHEKLLPYMPEPSSTRKRSLPGGIEIAAPVSALIGAYLEMV